VSPEPAGSVDLSGITSSHYIDVRIADDALEAAFVDRATKSAQQGRHRLASILSFLLLAAVIPRNAGLWGSEPEPGSAMHASRWLLFATWLLASCVTFFAFWHAKTYTLEEYRVRIRWAFIFGYFGCLGVSCGFPLILEHARLAQASAGDESCYPAMRSRHLYFLHFIYMRATLLQGSFVGFYCFGSSTRDQVAVSLTTWGLINIANWVLGNSNFIHSFQDTSFIVTMVVVHTACCITITVGNCMFGKMQRQAFLYTSMLVAEVQSEREQKSEARAAGEKAVCAWVCHEV
jgi:hypothetical protein